MAIALIGSMRKQAAVYWPLATPPADKFGQPSYESPVEIQVRFVRKTEMVATPRGEVRAAHGHAYVDRDMKSRERLLLGPLTSQTSADPNQAGASEILAFQSDPTFRGDQSLRTVWLA